MEIKLRQNEYLQLESNIMTDGCREPITTWHGIIVDGHTTLSLAFPDQGNRIVVVPRQHGDGRHDYDMLRLEGQIFASRERCNVTSFEEIKAFIQQELKGLAMEEVRNAR